MLTLWLHSAIAERPRKPSINISRKLSIISIDNDQAMVELGEAIRSGQIEFLNEILEERNGIGSSIFNRLGIQFEVSLRKLSKKQKYSSKDDMIDPDTIRFSKYSELRRLTTSHFDSEWYSDTTDKVIQII